MSDKRLWYEFYLIEKALFEWANECCECLWSAHDGPLTYRKYQHPLTLKWQEKPPRFIHWIGRCYGYEEQGQAISRQLVEAYDMAAGKNAKHPSRFPLWFSEVEQINVSMSKAHMSLLMRSGWIELYTVGAGSSMERIEADLQVLLDTGFDAKIDRAATSFGEGDVALQIGVASIRRVANTSAVRVHKQTGIQYRARIRHNNASSATPCRLGFIICDSKSEALVVPSSPQGPRPHSLKNTARQIALPLDGLDYTLYAADEGGK